MKIPTLSEIEFQAMRRIQQEKDARLFAVRKEAFIDGAVFAIEKYIGQPLIVDSFGEWLNLENPNQNLSKQK